MRVIWDSRAKEAQRQIAAYIRHQFGVKFEKNFMQKVDQTVCMLVKSPNIGRIDPLFADRPIAYRSIVINGLSKLVYYIKDDTIRIAAFWDTRREPVAQAAKVEE